MTYWDEKEEERYQDENGDWKENTKTTPRSGCENFIKVGASRSGECHSRATGGPRKASCERQRVREVVVVQDAARK